MSHTIRQATEVDLPQLKELMLLSFGPREGEDSSVSDQTTKYIVYVIDDKVVAMTGLVYSEEFKSLEIAWTCTHPDCRGKGYMHELFNTLLSDVKEKVYCSCWHLSNKEHINLYKLMRDFGFKQVLDSRVGYAYGHNCYRDCVCRTKPDCTCKEELYLRQV